MSGAMRVGSLFSGVGGLDLAVEDVFEAETSWHCEFDAAPSKVLEHRWPGVPNFGDVRTVNFRDLSHTHIRCGGFPCQDVSVSGARRGLRDGTRSGLWSEFARSIEEDRPEWVVIENVGGLLSAEAHSDVEPCPWCLGDEPSEPALRALGAVLADLAALGFDAEWTSIRASDVGAPHGRLRVFILAWPAERTVADDDSTGRGSIGWPSRVVERDAHGRDREGTQARGLSLLPTPVASSGRHGGPGRTYSNGSPTLDGIGALLPTPLTDPETGNGHARHLGGEVALLPTPLTTTATGVQELERRIGGRGSLLPTPTVTNAHGNERNGRGENLLPGVARLLPTPTVVMNDGEDKETWLARRERVKERGINGNGMGMPLPIAVQLLPTPGAYDGHRGGSQHPDKRRDGGHSVTIQDVAEHVVPSSDWGPYAAAIRRWEYVTGRTAPSPVRFDGKGGKARLNPELTEWMMGWPEGWVTGENEQQWRARLIARRDGSDPRPVGMRGSIRRWHPLSRAEQLKACGNGVVPQQAAAAIRELLARPGVPAVDRRVAA